MTITPGIEVPAEELAAICRKFHVRELSLFGSAVRGEMHKDSDVDLLVVFDPDARIGWPPRRLGREAIVETASPAFGPA